jgi:hypothetical protein
MPYGDRALEIELNLSSSLLEVRTSDGTGGAMPLETGSLAAFWARYFELLHDLGFDVSISPLAVEIPQAVHLDRDDRVRPYDPDWAHRFHRAMTRADAVLKRFRSDFIGKASPVHFFWGSFDLAVTRFSGRRAPPHPGGAPHCRNEVMIEAYSHEVSSAGFWPGGINCPEPMFYSYAYPEPDGFKSTRVLPDAARYDETFRDFVLPYAAVDDERELMMFLKSTYAAAAELGDWPRRELERSPPPRPDLEPGLHNVVL